ncbi:hypothetical protein F511_18852 [Dorcoceras hygrometricum]|uniref:Acyl-CoA dehydrogenase-related protein n=1 Tax=Dorcoceras hygrometricum TaxID=472368 RepID=A0A2Z7D8C9_9LAMI|nr:hypothetical protein F511_18852 [Dorcoceras hygrometricum]
MSLFDLQDVCIAIGSLATLDLPMVVDLIGIYGLKGPYCTLTTTNWFLQALSVIPGGSWRDVARRFTMIRWATPPFPKPPPPATTIAAAAAPRRNLFRPTFQRVSVHADLVRPSSAGDEGTLLPVVDLIRRNLPPPTVKSQSPCDSGWSQAPVASEMLAGNTKREVESDTVAEQELKTVKRDFGGLNEGIWPKSSLDVREDGSARATEPAGAQRWISCCANVNESDVNVKRNLE